MNLRQYAIAKMSESKPVPKIISVKADMSMRTKKKKAKTKKVRKK